MSFTLICTSLNNPQRVVHSRPSRTIGWPFWVNYWMYFYDFSPKGGETKTHCKTQQSWSSSLFCYDYWIFWHSKASKTPSGKVMDISMFKTHALDEPWNFLTDLYKNSCWFYCNPFEKYAQVKLDHETPQIVVFPLKKYILWSSKSPLFGVLEKWPNPKLSILQCHDWKGRTPWGSAGNQQRQVFGV